MLPLPKHEAAHRFRAVINGDSKTECNDYVYG